MGASWINSNTEDLLWPLVLISFFSAFEYYYCVDMTDGTECPGASASVAVRIIFKKCTKQFQILVFSFSFSYMIWN